MSGGFGGPVAVLRARREYLDARIEAKQRVGWETQWDERERDALAWAIVELDDLAALRSRLAEGAPA